MHSIRFGPAKNGTALLSAGEKLPAIELKAWLNVHTPVSAIELSEFGEKKDFRQNLPKDFSRDQILELSRINLSFDSKEWLGAAWKVVWLFARFWTNQASASTEPTEGRFAFRRRWPNSVFCWHCFVAFFFEPAQREEVGNCEFNSLLRSLRKWPGCRFIVYLPRSLGNCVINRTD